MRAADPADSDSQHGGREGLSGRKKALVPQLIEELKKLGREDILVTVGGVIPPQDYDFLYKAGAVGVYGPGTVIPVCAQQILRILTHSTVEEKA